MSTGDAERGASGDTHALVRARVLTFQRFRLRVLEGPDHGAEQVSEDRELAVGTAAGNQLVLTDRAVSRHHCVINAVQDDFVIRDLSSTNGTTLGGYRIRCRGKE